MCRGIYGLRNGANLKRRKVPVRQFSVSSLLVAHPSVQKLPRTIASPSPFFARPRRRVSSDACRTCDHDGKPVGYSTFSMSRATLGPLPIFITTSDTSPLLDCSTTRLVEGAQTLGIDITPSSTRSSQTIPSLVPFIMESRLTAPGSGLSGWSRTSSMDRQIINGGDELGRENGVRDWWVCRSTSTTEV